MDYINKIDILFDKLLNNFYYYINSNNIFTKLVSDANYVKYQQDIINIIKNFIDDIKYDDLSDVIKTKTTYNQLIDILKTYCAYYIFLGLAYHYKESKDLFVTNLIEISKNQQETSYQIPNFFNSNTNAIIISYYTDIKNILFLLTLESIDQMKIFLFNDINKYNTTINIINEFGEEYIQTYFMVEDKFHNIIKSIIFRLIYYKYDKEIIYHMIEENILQKDVEYRYIQIIVAAENKLIDYNIIEQFLKYNKVKSMSSFEIYDYLRSYKKDIYIDDTSEFMNYMFNNNVFIPITEEFMRYHKDIVYDTDFLVEQENISIRHATKIKSIMSKINLVKNYYDSTSDNKKIEELFYKQIENKMVLLFNEFEEQKILHKLQNFENISDYKLLLDLQNIRKYTFINFNHFSKDGFILRPSNTIQTIRSTSLTNKENSLLDIRISNIYNECHVIGLCFNPSKRKLETIKTHNLINIKTLNSTTTNQYTILTDLLYNKLLEPDNNVYYWLFDIKQDKPKIDTFESYALNNSQQYITIMLKYIYKVYTNLLENYYYNLFITNAKISYDILIQLYSIDKQYFYIHNILPTVLLYKISNEVVDIYKDDDTQIKKEILLLPSVTIKDNKIKSIILKEKIIEINVPLSKSIAICKHYIEWNNIKKLSRKSDVFNQSVFDFVQHYVKMSNHDQFICKSCGELLEVQKFIFEGTYVEELDVYLTTSMSLNINLYEVEKYKNLTRTIRNLDKLIERIAYFSDLTQYVGSNDIIKLKRKVIVKDCIDLIMLHTGWLMKQPKNRIDIYHKNYGIQKNLTNLFFFELKDDIFLTSSTDTDYYKLIKYNNIIVYILILLITDMNEGQILNFKNNLKYSFDLFQSVYTNIFNEIYLRISEQNKIDITSAPLLCYIIFYFSIIVVSKKLWLYDDSTIDQKNKQMYSISLQTIVIHTVIDLLNTLSEASIEISHYLYKIIVERFYLKFKILYSNKDIFKKLQESTDVQSKQINTNIQCTLYQDILIEHKYTSKIHNYAKCDYPTYYLHITDKPPNYYKLSQFYLCDNGKIHNWKYSDHNIECVNCSIKYDNIITQKYIDSNKYKQFMTKINNIFLSELYKYYCISGSIHEFNDLGICVLCNFNINSDKIDKTQLKNLENNINNKLYVDYDNSKKILNKYYKDTENEKNNIDKILLNIYNNYKNISNNKITTYIKLFVDKIKNVLGEKINIKDTFIYTSNKTYRINHDINGNILKDNHVIILERDKTILLVNHKYFNKNVLVYKLPNLYYYYDYITHQYLGHSKDNTNITLVSSEAILLIQPSLYDIILSLGCENTIYDLYHLERNFDNLTPYEIYSNILRTRIYNLKNIIVQTQAILYKLNNNKVYKDKSFIGSILSSIKVVKFLLNQEKSKKNIFKNLNIVCNNIFINNTEILEKSSESKLQILDDHYIDILSIISKNNNDSILLFYYIYNLYKFLENNDELPNIIEIYNMIVLILYSMYYSYYIPYNNYNVRKFDYLITNYSIYLDDKLKSTEKYEDIILKENIDENEEKYTNDEEKNALDLDDYDNDDDIDDRADALGYEQVEGYD